MAKKSDEKKKAPAKNGATELAEDQLDEISGGPHYTTFDGIKSVPLPAGSIRKIDI